MKKTMLLLSLMLCVNSALATDAPKDPSSILKCSPDQKKYYVAYTYQVGPAHSTDSVFLCMHPDVIHTEAGMRSMPAQIRQRLASMLTLRSLPENLSHFAVINIQPMAE